MIWEFREAASPYILLEPGGPGQVRTGCGQGSALPSQGQTLLCPPSWCLHGCFDLHEVPDVHLQRAGVCESIWALWGAGVEGTCAWRATTPAGSGVGDTSPREGTKG